MPNFMCMMEEAMPRRRAVAGLSDPHPFGEATSCYPVEPGALSREPGIRGRVVRL